MSSEPVRIFFTPNSVVNGHGRPRGAGRSTGSPGPAAGANSPIAEVSPSPREARAPGDAAVAPRDDTPRAFPNPGGHPVRVVTMSSSSEEVTHSESESSDAGESGDENDALATRGSLDVVGYAATTTARASPPAFRALESFSSDKKDPPARHPKRRKTRRKKLDALGVCLVNCKYPLLRDVTSKLGYREVGEEEDWCLYWTDTSVAIERVMRLKPLQKINHFTGMLEICRKKALARNLRRVAAKLPASFDFAPQTFVLPEELEAFSDAVKGNRASVARKGADGKKKKSAKTRATTFILKPDAGCQGKGITLVQTEAQAQTALRDLGVIGPETGTNKSGFANVQKTASVVAQKYVSDPFLIDGRKFDLRVYVLVTCADPLRVFVYDDGLVRFCTNAYEAPDAKNLHDACMHLTNYAVNKNSENFVRAEDVDKAAARQNGFASAPRTPAERARALLREEARYPSGLGDASSGADDTSSTGETSPRFCAETEPVSRPVGDGGLASKWSVRGGLKPWMRRNGHDFDRVWASVIDVCVKTVIAAAPTLRHNYRNAMRRMDRSGATASRDEDGCEKVDDSIAPNENVDDSIADASSSSCFEVLGVDVMLDKKLKCWLVEVNHSPSFATDSELDRDVKESLITDTLRLVRLDSKAMKKHRLREQTSARERLGVEDAEVRGGVTQKEKALGTHTSTFRLAKPKKKKAPFFDAETNRHAQNKNARGAYRLAFPSEDDFVAQASYEEALRVATEAFETHGAHARARDAMRRAAESSRRKLAESRVKALFHERGAALPAGERFRKAVDRAMRHRERTGEDADWETVHPKKRGFLTSGNRRGSSRGSSRSASRQGSAEGRARGATSAASAARRAGASGGETSGDATSSDEGDDDDDDDDYGTRGILRIAKAGGLAASLARDSLMRGAVRRDPPRPRPAPRSVVDLQGDAIRRLMESRAAEARASLATAEAKAKLGRLSLGGTRDAREAVRRFESFLNDASGENVDAASGSRPIGRGSHLRNSSGVFGTSSFAGGAHSLQTKRPPRRDPRAERAAPERAGAGDGAGRLGLGMGLVGEKLATAG